MKTLFIATFLFVMSAGSSYALTADPCLETGTRKIMAKVRSIYALIDEQSVTPYYDDGDGPKGPSVDVMVDVVKKDGTKCSAFYTVEMKGKAGGQCLAGRPIGYCK